MLAGVLTVLRIIGIVLLWILAIILAILLLILLVPIRYRLDANVPEMEFEEGFDTDKISCSAKITWLLHFISATIAYPDNKEFTVKILGIKILPKSEKEDDDKARGEKKRKKKEKTDDESSEEAGNNLETKSPSSQNDVTDAEQAENPDIVPEEKQDLEQDKEKVSESDNIDIGYEDEEEKTPIEIVLQIVERVQNFLTTPLNVFENIRYTTSRLYDKIRMIKTTLENDIFKRAFELVKRKLIRLLKMIAPDKARVDLKLGLGDPADTAEVMALYGAFYPVIFRKVSFEPDFDRKVIYADAHFKGHITVATVLYCVGVCYFNKDVKKVIRRFKKILNS
ncbi:DUF2953 domain-containing protein [Butyrivibrio sp. INlla14]|uniref:DUF2953 domain-containing protein n=1 Tax=Butyrivibrio sp. INlla14 TaxID=1520808 RepID=UPI000876D05B|nr:DUF2953 domain-containing protein [Butyrivibrio sp. INlla14]SCX82994.1 Protein of unknown function [Butyrivibrio sp. INlla14]